MLRKIVDVSRSDHWIWTACLFLSLMQFGTPAIAQTVQESGGQDDLAAWAHRLKDSYQEVTPADVARAKSSVRSRLDRLDEYLPDNNVGKGWKTYLDWKVLLDQLAEEVEPNLEQLQAVHAKFTANYAGLEQRRFRRVADALGFYIDLLAVTALPNAAEHHAAQMESLAQALATYAAEPTAERTRSIAQGLQWLEQSGQAAELVRAVHEQFSHPNLLVGASARFVVAGMGESLDYTQPLSDRILGATVTGLGHTTGTMDAELVADPNHAVMRWMVKGRTDMETVGRKRRVTVWGDGVTTFTARKTLTFDQSGFVGGLASSSARSDIWPRQLSAPPLMGRLAWRRIQRQRSEGSRLVARHAEPLINDRLDQDAGEIILWANDAYASEFRNPLLRSRAFPRQVKFSTSNKELKVVILQAAQGQIGAPQPAPSFDLAHDIGIRMHETAFNNLAESLLAGRTLTDEEVRAKVAMFLTMTSLEEFSPNLDETPWSITFAQKNPITVEFSDGAYTLVVAGERWKSGRRRYSAQMNVTVTYRIATTDGKVRLVRDKEVLIAPPGFVRGKSRLPLTTLSLRRILQRKFDELFPAMINPEELVVPGPWEKTGPLRVGSMAADSGWLQMSWQMQLLPVGEAGGGSVLTRSQEDLP